MTRLAEPGQRTMIRPPGYRAAVSELRRAYQEVPDGSPVRLAQSTSNLLRCGDPRAADVRLLDVRPFTRVLSVDLAARVALVGGMTTFEDLAAATLRHGLMPLVVPQLQTITVGR